MVEIEMKTSKKVLVNKNYAGEQTELRVWYQDFRIPFQTPPPRLLPPF